MKRERRHRSKHACRLAVGLMAAGVSLGCGSDRASSPSPSPAAPQNALTFSGDPGEYVSDGRSWQLSSQEALFAAATACNGSFIEIQVRPPNDLWILRLVAPTGRTLAPGQFGGAVNWSTQQTLSPSMMLSGNGRACGRSGGDFTVAEAQFAPDGSVIRFAASFGQRCVNFIEEPRLSMVPWLRGTVSLTNPPKPSESNLPCR